MRYVLLMDRSKNKGYIDRQKENAKKRGIKEQHNA